MQELGYTLQTAQRSNGTRGQQLSSTRPITALSGLSAAFSQLGKSLRDRIGQRSAPLPTHHLPNATRLQPRPQGPISHLLYCIRQEETGLKLHQERIEDVSTDYDLMLFLKTEYRKLRKPFSWLRLRHVSQVYLDRASSTIHCPHPRLCC